IGTHLTTPFSPQPGIVKFIYIISRIMRFCKAGPIPNSDRKAFAGKTKAAGESDSPAAFAKQGGRKNNV
ncbi:MAG: hypothetical protein ACOCS6_03085, partial [Desulfosalsimonas sp.]